jgi:hypothetical protein
VLLICLAVVHNLKLFRQQTHVDHSDDNVAQFDRSLRELRKMLPQKGTVGYIAAKPAGDILDDADETRRYYLTQYSLAPLVVTLGTAPSLVIGDSAGGAISGVQDSGLVLLRNFGNGVMLFRKSSE